MNITKINLIGWPFLKAGMGEHLRKVTTGFDAVNMEYTVVDVLEQCFNDMSFFENDDLRLKGKESPKLENDISIYGLNLNHLPRIDKNLYNAKIKIAYGYYELSSLLDPFVEYQDYVDEIWAPSIFIQKVLSKKLTIPVVYMPIPIEVQGKRSLIREKLQLPRKQFLFLTTFDMRSLIERKNPYAVIDAYKIAFDKINCNVGLAIKTTYSEHDKNQVKQLQALKEYCKNIKNVHFIAKTLEHNEVLDLMNDCDAYISLHRAEGLGLGMAESMCLGKLVIGTAYSGNMEFMTPNNSCLVDYKLVNDETYKKMLPNYHTDEQFFWADADIDNAAFYMKKVCLDDGFRKRIEKNAKKHMLDNYSAIVIGRQYKDRLKILSERIH